MVILKILGVLVLTWILQGFVRSLWIIALHKLAGQDIGRANPVFGWYKFIQGVVLVCIIGAVDIFLIVSIVNQYRGK